eukprot:5857391-Prymnesium_polylepis.1
MHEHTITLDFIKIAFNVGVEKQCCIRFFEGRLHGRIPVDLVFWLLRCCHACKDDVPAFRSRRQLIGEPV